MSKKPSDIIQVLIGIRDTWTDAEILAERESLPILPDEYIAPRLLNPAWDDDEVIAQLDLFLALRSLVAMRKLREGVPMLLMRACYGDFGETMRGLPKRLRAAFDQDIDALAEVYMQGAKYPQKGSRLWVITDLGEFHDRKGQRIINQRLIRTLIEALYDPARLVRNQAIEGLEYYAESPEYRSVIIPALERFLMEQHDNLKQVQKLLGNIQQIDPE